MKMWHWCWWFLPLLLAGCTTTTEQEQGVPTPYSEPAGDCREINDHYHASPQSVAGIEVPQRALLAIMLLPYEAALEQAASVALQLEPGGALEVSAYAADGTLMQARRYPADSGVFSCEEGELQLVTARLQGDGETGYDWERIVLRRTEAGSLMLRKGGLFSGMLFILFPMSLSSGDWFVFAPLE